MATTPASASSSNNWAIVLRAILVVAPPWLAAVGLIFTLPFVPVEGVEWQSATTVLGVFLLSLALLWLVHQYERAFLCVAKKQVEEIKHRGDLNRLVSILRIPSATASKDMLDALSRVRDHLQDSIDEEYKNVGLRVTWMLAGQAFMLGPLTTIGTSSALNDRQRTLIIGAICLCAAMVSLVLTWGAMLGHAYIEDMRKLRDQAEEELHFRFGVPATGVAAGSGLHKLEHSASRYLPLLFYCFWVVLLPLVPRLQAMPQGPNCCAVCPSCPPPPPPPGPVGGSAWLFAGRTHPFPRGEAEYPGKRSAQERAGCPTIDTARAWVEGFVQTWMRRPDPRTSDILMVIGGTDRASIEQPRGREADPNLALSRRRADEVLRLLADATVALAPEHRIVVDRVMVVLTGPGSKSPANPKIRKGQCGDQDDDRAVQLWYQSAR